MKAKCVIQKNKSICFCFFGDTDETDGGTAGIMKTRAKDNGKTIVCCRYQSASNNADFRMKGEKTTLKYPQTQN